MDIFYQASTFCKSKLILCNLAHFILLPCYSWASNMATLATVTWMELGTSSIHLCFCKFSSDDLILYAAENVVVYEQKTILVTASDIYAEVLGTKI